MSQSASMEVVDVTVDTLAHYKRAMVQVRRRRSRVSEGFGILKAASWGLHDVLEGLLPCLCGTWYQPDGGRRAKRLRARYPIVFVRVGGGFGGSGPPKGEYIAISMGQRLGTFQDELFDAAAAQITYP
jgi:hypothetical protein